MSKIKDMLPDKNTQMLQAFISAELYARVREQMLKDKAKWRSVLEACLTKYLEESKK